MRIVTWTIRLVLFLLLIALAAKNIEPVTLRFYFDLALQAPLIVMLFGAFAAGAPLWAPALLGAAVRPRRESSFFKKQQQNPPGSPPPLPPPSAPQFAYSVPLGLSPFFCLR